MGKEGKGTKWKRGEEKREMEEKGKKVETPLY